MSDNSLFMKLQAAAFRDGIRARTAEARKWFKDKASKVSVSRRDLIEDDRTTIRQRPASGRMYHFFYDPKHRESLPYYDMFPLIIMVGPAPGGFYGINLHYLPPALRAKFLDKLLEITSDKRMNERTKFRLSYSLLKNTSKYKEFEPCFKHYLSKHVNSQIAEIHAPEWEIAVFLPTEQFAKKSKRAVWSDSRRAIK